ncbi:hypothetical protein ARHIZOSPH14_03680 [Agromyces rhizosphaerae]|uniref:Uncharacterized protein n=1 Tax=Agromyces rhizosphaerae TaxID=88374 RepID=A0A9W6CP08_9MICO|nr:hypothetical protein [Agromyces rhizosphaerae]GLI26126.1 hypothetical protein ARHIZOSPH14_03680 [Agromyces rhizosphaerae]
MPPASRLPAALAAVALALASAGWVVQAFVPSLPEALAATLTVLFWWVVPTLTVCAFVAAVAAGGMLGRIRALGVAVVGSAGYACATLATLGFTQGVAALDEDLPDPPLTRIIVPLVVIGWLLGALAIGMLLDAVGRERMPRTGPRLGIAALVGIVLAPLAGLAGANPAFSLIPPAAILLVETLRNAEHRVRPAPGAIPERAWLPVALLAWTGLVGGAAGILLAMAGTMVPGGLDGTGALAAGLAVAGMAAVPIIVAVLIVGVRRSATPVRSAVLPLAALAFVELTPAVHLLVAGPVARPGTPLDVLPGMVALGLATGCLAWTLVPVDGVARLTVGAVSGLAVAAFGALLAPALPFATPFAALAVLAWARRARRAQGQPMDDSSTDAISSTSK